jgi:T-complex protein 1 subunit gamma
VGTNCGLFEMRKIGDEYFVFFEKCKNHTACSIILRGGSKDTLNEMERNLHDALGVARNLFAEPRLLYGGGAVEMQI